jgi:hypothetical protein
MGLLTTPSAARHRFWNRFGAVSVMCAVLVLVELALRVVGPSLPAPTRWSPPEAAAKVAQMRALSSHGATGGIAFVGTSVMDVGIDAGAVAVMPGVDGPGYNASLSGIDLKVLEWWTTAVVVPALKPRIVVLGLTSHEMNPNDDEASRNARQFFAAPAVRDIAGTNSVLDKLEGKAEEYSEVFRYRSVLRSPGKVVGLGGADSVPDLNAGGMNLIYAGAQYDRSTLVDSRFREHVLNRFQVGSDQRASLGLLVAKLTAAGVRTIVVDMPVTQHYIDLHPHGSSDYASYEAAVAQITGANHVELRSASIWDERMFADPFHLNGAGSRQFANFIATIVSAP